MAKTAERRLYPAYFLQMGTGPGAAFGASGHRDGLPSPWELGTLLALLLQAWRAPRLPTDWG